MPDGVSTLRARCSRPCVRRADVRRAVIGARRDAQEWTPERAMKIERHGCVAAAKSAHCRVHGTNGLAMLYLAAKAALSGVIIAIKAAVADTSTLGALHCFAAPGLARASFGCGMIPATPNRSATSRTVDVLVRAADVCRCFSLMPAMLRHGNRCLSTLAALLRADVRPLSRDDLGAQKIPG